MDQQAFHGVADRGTGHLGVVHDIRRHVDVGFLVNINVVDPFACLQHGHLGIFHHGLYQPAAPPGDKQIHIALQGHECRGALPAGILHQLHSVLRQLHVLQGSAHDVHQCCGRVDGFFAAP